MLKNLDRKTVLKAIGSNQQILVNKLLYSMCRQYPRHTNAEEVTAKLLIIGRVYAAWLERRRNASTSSRGDRFFRDIAVPQIVSSRTDIWFDDLRAITAAYSASSPETRKAVIETHQKVLRLFYRSTKLNKRSLASKYLHFHFPEVCYIYDSRALSAARKLTGRANRLRFSATVDAEYALFVHRCELLNASAAELIGRQRLNPREIDNMLLNLEI
jgi:hypothetical protein